MEREREVRFRETCVQPIGEHGPCAFHHLLGRLRDHDKRAAPQVLVLGHPACGAYPSCHVQIVAAGVHHRSAIRHADFTRNREAGLFFHRERVRISSEQDVGSRSIPENRYHTVSAHSWCDLVSECLHLRRQPRRCLLLVQ